MLVFSLRNRFSAAKDPGVGNWAMGPLLPERLPELDFLELLCRGVGFGTGRRRCGACW